ncbi:MAG: thioredoxin family protein [Limnospira sp.]
MKGTPINSYAPDFELPGVDDEVHHLARYLERFRAVIVVFMSNCCPHVRSALEGLKGLQAELQPQEIILVGINANDATRSPEDSFDKMKAFADSNDLNFPYIRDVNQDVAQCFGAQTTPEAFLLDNRGILRYRGSIDHSADSAGEPSTPGPLHVAVTQLLRGEAIDPAITSPAGTPIQWRG